MQNDYKKQSDLFQTKSNLQDASNLVRPKTVGYYQSPLRQQFGRNKLMIEDRNAHIGGTILE